MSRLLAVVLFSLVATLGTEAFVTYHHAFINPIFPLNYAYVPQQWDPVLLQTRFDRWDLLDLIIAFLRPSPTPTSEQPESANEIEQNTRFFALQNI